jgi:hypothetical protein
LDGQFLESREITVETSDSAILSPSDRKVSTNYVFFALLQVMPKHCISDSEGTLSNIDSMDYDDGNNDDTGDISTEKEDDSAPKTLQGSCDDGSPKTESRHKSNANNYNGQEEIKELKMVNTLVCKHCKNEDIQAVFLPESAEDL